MVNNPSFTTNTLPVVVSSSTVAPGAGTTTATLTPPASITDGNALWLAINVNNVSSETFTFPAGFTQVGTNVSSVANGKIFQAVACKIASSESGNYVTTYTTNGTPVAVILNISGTSCTPDVTPSFPSPGNAATLTQATFNTIQTNDLILVFAGQAAGGATRHTLLVNEPASTRNAEASFGSVLSAITLPFGVGATPSLKFQFTDGTATGAGPGATTNDSIVMTYALPATVTASQSSFQFGGANVSSSLYTIGGALYGGTVQAPTFLVPNGVTSAGASNSFGSYTAAGTAFSLIGVNGANNIQIDATEKMGFVTVGSGTHSNSNDLLLIQPAGIDFISQDNSADLNLFASDASNNVYLGCDTRSLTACAAGGNQENDVFLSARTGKTLHFAIAGADIATEIATAFNLLSGQTLQSTGGAIPTATCSGGSTGVTVAAGSTNNRGKLTTSSSASTNCTITWSAAGVWNQAPFCVFGSDTATVPGLAAGAVGTSTAVVNFTSGTSQVIDYLCM